MKFQNKFPGKLKYVMDKQLRLSFIYAKEKFTTSGNTGGAKRGFLESCLAHSGSYCKKERDLGFWSVARKVQEQEAGQAKHGEGSSPPATEKGGSGIRQQPRAGGS